MKNIPRGQRPDIAVVIDMDIVIPTDKAIFSGRSEDQEWDNNQKEDDYCAGGDDFMGFLMMW